MLYPIPFVDSLGNDQTKWGRETWKKINRSNEDASNTSVVFRIRLNPSYHSRNMFSQTIHPMKKARQLSYKRIFPERCGCNADAMLNGCWFLHHQWRRAIMAVITPPSSMVFVWRLQATPGWYSSFYSTCWGKCVTVLFRVTIPYIKFDGNRQMTFIYLFFEVNGRWREKTSLCEKYFSHREDFCDYWTMTQNSWYASLWTFNSQFVK